MKDKIRRTQAVIIRTKSELDKVRKPKANKNIIYRWIKKVCLQGQAFCRFGPIFYRKKGIVPKKKTCVEFVNFGNKCQNGNMSVKE